MKKSALVTGGAGQDGCYLVDKLLADDYSVHVQSRHAGAKPTREGVHWHIGDPTDYHFMERLVSSVRPDEIFNLAAISRPAASWNEPLETAMLNAVMPQQLCDLMRKLCPNSRLFQASSSEIFGEMSQDSSQNEETPFKPMSPYAIAKAYAHRIIGAYRSQYDLHLSAGILFNHESPKRPLSFVSQKIAHAAAAVSLGLSQTTDLDERGRPILQDGKVMLGDLSVRRDFGYAGDYIEAMLLIVRSDRPDDYVIGSGEQHSIAEFCETAFRVVGRDWQNHVISDPGLIRKTDNRYTRADPSKIHTQLGWRATTSFEDLVGMMVRSRIEAITLATAD
ncbi:GDP-mannose 4,6-dehydratase [Tardiphaga sp. P9-11]|uniref:GDP-mannose 4,6-dehydratase n=1 Tax=Tardiphaga sp. P9-11 TaxID=2024614 RepID=UPI0011F0D2DF|nr:GDP-mannose 4,6-dehydratase [Tardiphaga sp. P9-11]KAA0073036.1 NAD-dependent epimerase/dehydratase family protein [Tardiphaga sp. P9-11]